MTPCLHLQLKVRDTAVSTNIDTWYQLTWHDASININSVREEQRVRVALLTRMDDSAKRLLGFSTLICFKKVRCLQQLSRRLRG